MTSHTGHRQRMKAEFLARGIEGWPDHRVLELLLFYSIPQGDVNGLAHDLIEQFGSLSGVLDASVEELRKVKGVGEHTAVLLRMLPALLISLIGEVERYLAEDEADPARDGLGVSAATLFMNDAEWRAFGEKLSALVMEAAALPPGEGRRQRRLTTILTPADMRPGRWEK